MGTKEIRFHVAVQVPSDTSYTSVYRIIKERLAPWKSRMSKSMTLLEKAVSNKALNRRGTLFQRALAELEDLRCPTCNGDGECTRVGLHDIFHYVWSCDACHGTGMKPDQRGGGG